MKKVWKALRITSMSVLTGSSWGKPTKPHLSAKRLLPATSPAGNYSTKILTSIDKKLSSFNARISLLEILHREFQVLRESLEFSQQQVQTLAAENAALRGLLKSLTEGMSWISDENKRMK